jgi:hypothetical protein
MGESEEYDYMSDNLIAECTQGKSMRMRIAANLYTLLLLLNIWLRKNGCKYKKRHAGTFFSQET